MCTLLNLPKVNFNALSDQITTNSLTEELWTDDTFHNDIKPESAWKNTHVLLYYSQAYPPEPTVGHRCPPIHYRAHSQVQRGSPINAKPIIGSGWATGSNLTQSDRECRKGLLLDTSYEQGIRGLPEDAIQSPDNHRHTRPWVKLLPEGCHGGEMARTQVSYVTLSSWTHCPQGPPYL